jgi:DNA polymerase-3 subunit delta
MYPEELQRSIAARKFSPVYCFYGDNTLLMDATLRELITALFPDPAASLDLHQYTAPTHTPAAILQSLRTMPFSSGKKLVVIREAQAFKAADWEKLQAYCAKPAAWCCAVFMLQTDAKEKKEKARVEALEKYGPAVVFLNPRTEKQRSVFIRAALTRQGKEIAPDALACLSAVLDEDAQGIDRELEKLALYCGQRKKVVLEDVERVVSGGARGTVFTLVDAVAQGNVGESILLLKSLRETGSHPLALLKMIARQFRFIGIAQELFAAGASESVFRQKIRVPERALQGIMRQARTWPAGSMGKVFNVLFQTNGLLKSSRIDGGIILEHLVLRLRALRDQPCAGTAV